MPGKNTPRPCGEPRAGDSVVQQRSKPPTMLPTQAAEAAIAAADRCQELTALVDFDGDALLQAAADLERTPVAMRGPLYGVPIGIKDNIDVAGLRHDSWLSSDATATTALRRTRRAPYAYGGGLDCWPRQRCTNSGSGLRRANLWSGPVRNPHNANLVAGGSSGGSAAAVAAGILPSGARHGHRRFHPDPGRALWRRGLPADDRTLATRRYRPDLPDTRRCRSHRIDRRHVRSSR